MYEALKKSQLYREAAMAVMRDAALLDYVKLDIIEELLDRKNLEKFCEEQAEKEAAV